MESCKALYEYLLKKGDEWTPQAEVARDLFREFGNGECIIEPGWYHNTSERVILSKTIAKINEDRNFEKIIISSRKGIKIANEKEHHQYVVNQYRSVLKKLKRIYIMERKGNADGQISLDGRTIEAYLRGVDDEMENF